MTSSTTAEAHEQMDVEDPDLESEPVNQCKDKSMSNLNSTMIHDKGFRLQAVGILNPSPSAGGSVGRWTGYHAR